MHRPTRRLVSCFCLLLLLGTACGDELTLLDSTIGRHSGSPDHYTRPTSPAPSERPSHTDTSVATDSASDADRDGEQPTTESGGEHAWVKITWQGAAPENAVNLDLHVIDANGSHIYYLRTSSQDDTARFAPHDECISFDCNGDEQNPSETIYWVRADMQPGSYEAWVENASETSGSFDIEIDVPGTTLRESGTVGANAESSRWVFEVADDESGTCIEKLQRRGVNFQPITIAEGSCVVDDAVMVNSPVNGVTYRVSWAHSTTRFQTSCETALAIYESGQLMREHNIDTVYHMGSYNCRNVRGGSSLSKHAHALAMDYAGFRTTSGTEYSVVRHWEHNTNSPSTTAGQVLRHLASGLERYFDRVLDADFNADHDDHFHAELSGQ